MSISALVSQALVTVLRVSKYLALEGVDGSGKTTVGQALITALATRGIEAILVLDSESLDEWAEVFLFAAQRAELAHEVIAPALATDTWVISDRTYYSSIAYQGRARGLGEDRVRSINELGLRGVLPDHVFVLDVEPRLALQRQDSPDRIGKEGIEFQEAVRAAYRDLAAKEEKVTLLDGAMSVDQMVTAVLEVVS
jgi:dTMP kinase